MRKIVLTLLAGVLMLSAVEWDVEQVTSGGMPLIALDSEGNPHILFAQTGSNLLKLATWKQDLWTIDDVADVKQFLIVTYSLDVTPDDHNEVVYSGFIFEDDAELYLASDSTGEFAVTQLTDDNHSQDLPVIHVDDKGMIHIVYRYQSSDFIVDELFYGCIDTSGFHSEQVTENLSTGIPPSFDFILDNNDIPHVFYTADDQEQGLWHATQTSLTAPPSWSAQPTGITGIWPSVEIDRNGNFHIGCGDAYPTYVTDKSGTWEEETIIDSEDDGFPCLAVDPKSTPHVVLCHAPYEGVFDVRYSGRSEGSWSIPQSIPPLGQEKITGLGHYFVIDAQGYGHLTYVVEDTNSMSYVYYAKTTEPLASSIVESPLEEIPGLLEVKGASIHLTVVQTSAVKLDLYDVSGRRIERLASGFYSSGEHNVPINSAELPVGVYFVCGQIGEYPVRAKVSVTR